MKIETDFNTPGAADTALRSSDGYLHANKVVIDPSKKEVCFFKDETFLGKMCWTDTLAPGETLTVNFDVHFRFSLI